MGSAHRCSGASLPAGANGPLWSGHASPGEIGAPEVHPPPPPPLMSAGAQRTAGAATDGYECYKMSTRSANLRLGHFLGIRCFGSSGLGGCE